MRTAAVYTVNGVRSLTVGLHQLESLPTGVMTRLANAISTAILGLVPWGSSALPTAGGPDAGKHHTCVYGKLYPLHCISCPHISACAL